MRAFLTQIWRKNTSFQAILRYGALPNALLFLLKMESYSEGTMVGENYRKCVILTER